MNTKRFFALPAWFYLVLAGLAIAGTATAQQQQPVKSILSPERAGRAASAAADSTRKAVISAWLASQPADENAAQYSNLAELYNAVAQQQWQIWQAYHFDDAELQQQAESIRRATAKQASDQERAITKLNLPRPHVKVFAAGGEDGARKNAAKIAEHERDAINHARQSAAHSYRQENRREDFQRYNQAMADAYAELSRLHWIIWRAYHLNDNTAIAEIRGTIRAIQSRLDDYRRQRGDYQEVRRFTPASIAEHETVAINHGIRAVKYSQIALQVEGDLKQIYMSLADNYRNSSQIRRDMAHAAKTNDSNRYDRLDIRWAALQDERQILRDREKTAVDLLRKDPSTIEQRRKITQFKQEYQELRAQVMKMNNAD